MVGSFMCTLLECERGDWLLCPDRLIGDELCRDGCGLTTGIKVHWTLPWLQSTDLQIVACQLNDLCHPIALTLCAPSYLLNMFGSSSNLTWISCNLWGLFSVNVCIRVREALKTARCLMIFVRRVESMTKFAVVPLGVQLIRMSGVWGLWPGCQLQFGLAASCVTNAAFVKSRVFFGCLHVPLWWDEVRILPDVTDGTSQLVAGCGAFV